MTRQLFTNLTTWGSSVAKHNVPWSLPCPESVWCGESSPSLVTIWLLFCSHTHGCACGKGDVFLGGATGSRAYILHGDRDEISSLSRFQYFCCIGLLSSRQWNLCCFLPWKGYHLYHECISVRVKAPLPAIIVSVVGYRSLPTLSSFVSLSSSKHHIIQSQHLVASPCYQSTQVYCSSFSYTVSQRHEMSTTRPARRTASTFRIHNPSFAIRSKRRNSPSRDFLVYTHPT